MGSRHVARTVFTWALAGVILAPSLAAQSAATVHSSTAGSDGAQIRIATYRGEDASGYFAASVQPSADADLMAAVEKAPADVVILVDTSASQVGEFRSDSIAAVRTIAGKLRSGDRVRVYAADVSAADMTGSFIAASSIESAVNQLKKRLPLGNTNMVGVIDAVRSALVAEPQNHTRSIIYIGDGSSLDAMGDSVRFGARSSVHFEPIGSPCTRWPSDQRRMSN